MVKMGKVVECSDDLITCRVLALNLHAVLVELRDSSRDQSIFEGELHRAVVYAFRLKRLLEKEIQR